MNFSEKFLKVKDKTLYISDRFTKEKKLDGLVELIETSKKSRLWKRGQEPLQHFGYEVYFIGDLIKEPIENSDLVMLISGSGILSGI